MPVWHELTRPWREDDALVVIGLVQEQHPDRTRLYARWQQLDWPILWDPFNLTGATAVPRFVAIDEHGIVRAMVSPRTDARAFEEQFLDVDFDAAPADDGEDAEAVERTAGRAAAPAASATTSTDLWSAAPSGPGARAYVDALSAVLAAPGDGSAAGRAVTALEGWVASHPEDAAALFRLGVVRRMRHETAARRPDDFQHALDAWSAALDRDPNQYIWRRRIQQYGPRLDQPYAFYAWIDEAVAALTARGEHPASLTAPLTEAERALPREAVDGNEQEPDPGGRITRAGADWLDVGSAVVFDTSRGRPVARVHLEFRPARGSDVHWNNEVEPMRIWIGDPELPEGWSLQRRLLEHPLVSTAVSEEPRRVEFELDLGGAPDTTDASGRLTGYALFHACEGVDGVCVYRRRDFAVDVVPPGA